MIQAIVIGSLLALWLLLTFLRQLFPPVYQYLRVLNPFFCVPRWSLFSSPPVIFELQYQDRLAGGTLTEWQVAPLPRRYGISAALWNPSLLVGRNLWASASQIHQCLAGARQMDDGFTRAYETIRIYLQHEPHLPKSEARRFRIQRQSVVGAHTDMRILIESGFRRW